VALIKLDSATPEPAIQGSMSSRKGQNLMDLLKTEVQLKEFSESCVPMDVRKEVNAIVNLIQDIHAGKETISQTAYQERIDSFSDLIAERKIVMIGGEELIHGIPGSFEVIRKLSTDEKDAYLANLRIGLSTDDEIRLLGITYEKAA
jgi:hypothetical protein